MPTLDQKHCIPCRGGVDPLKGQELRQYADLIDDQWQVIDEHHLYREFGFADFRQALRFVNKVGELAEAEGHHPDIYLTYGKVKITLWTHKTGGLHENDFILATKIDRL